MARHVTWAHTSAELGCALSHGHQRERPFALLWHGHVQGRVAAACVQGRVAAACDPSLTRAQSLAVHCCLAGTYMLGQQLLDEFVNGIQERSLVRLRNCVRAANAPRLRAAP
eukprot:363790-Chlamydomonas_euryale.AAC.5